MVCLGSYMVFFIDQELVDGTDLQDTVSTGTSIAMIEQ
jgi:hypothetical protein